MGLLNILKRKKRLMDTGETAVEARSAPTPETMFLLNTAATDIMNSGDYGKYGFLSQLELVAAFTIVEKKRCAFLVR